MTNDYKLPWFDDLPELCENILDMEDETIEWLDQSKVVGKRLRNAFKEFEQSLEHIEANIGKLDDLELFKQLWKHIEDPIPIGQHITNYYERTWIRIKLFGQPYSDTNIGVIKRFPKTAKWFNTVSSLDFEEELDGIDQFIMEMTFYVITSGYFNPIHKGHIECFNRAKKFGDTLIVIVNSDLQVGLKGSKPFMDEEERMLIIGNIHAVDQVVLSIDKDKSVCETLKKLVSNLESDEEFQSEQGIYDFTHPRFCFIKGGDRFAAEIPEAKVCEEFNVGMIDGMGEKIQSSSSLLEKK